MRNHILRVLVPATIFVTTFGISMSQSHAQNCDTPPPTIHPGAAASLPTTAYAFAGIWQGQWPVAAQNSVLPMCARLYILVGSNRSATVEQCTGSSPGAGRRPECKQFVARIAGNLMIFTDLGGTIYNFSVADVGGMKAEAVSADHHAVTVFTKQE